VLARELLIALGVLMLFLWGGQYALEVMHLRQESVHRRRHRPVPDRPADDLPAAGRDHGRVARRRALHRADGHPDDRRAFRAWPR
jgi:hypothetical protein